MACLASSSGSIMAQPKPGRLGVKAKVTPLSLADPKGHRLGMGTRETQTCGFPLAFPVNQAGKGTPQKHTHTHTPLWRRCLHSLRIFSNCCRGPLISTDRLMNPEIDIGRTIIGNPVPWEGAAVLVNTHSRLCEPRRSIWFSNFVGGALKCTQPRDGQRAVERGRAVKGVGQPRDDLTERKLGFFPKSRLSAFPDLENNIETSTDSTCTSFISLQSATWDKPNSVCNLPAAYRLPFFRLPSALALQAN